MNGRQPPRRQTDLLADAVGAALNRREWLAGVGAIGVAVAFSGKASASGTAAAQPLDHYWSIDDMWSGFPRYSEAIGFGAGGGAPVAPDAVDAAWCE